MIYKAFTIYDRKSLIYSPPFFAVADGAAVRMFQDLVGDTGTQVGRHPADFVLFRCGGYDDGSGQLLAVAALEHVIDAMALVPRSTPLPFDSQPSAAASFGRRLDPTDRNPVEETRFNGSGV